jgi:hypothetical protein
MLYFMLTKRGSDFNKPGMDIWTDRVLLRLNCTTPLHFQAVLELWNLDFSKVFCALRNATLVGVDHE